MQDHNRRLAAERAECWEVSAAALATAAATLEPRLPSAAVKAAIRQAHWAFLQELKLQGEALAGRERIARQVNRDPLPG